MAVTSDQNVNWEITQGDTFSLELDYQDPDGNPIDLTNFSLVMEIKDKPGGRILSARCTNGDGIDIDTVNGKIFIEVTPEKTNKFNYPRASYQIQGTSDSNEKITFLQGWFLVNAGTIDG